jgi:DNA-binding NtrC family response regulator
MAPLPARILLVEDERDSREALESLLQIDFEVTAASGVMEAVNLLEQQDFDVLVTDYQMPGATGEDLLRYVQETQPGLLSIVLTGYPDAPAVKQVEGDEGVIRVVAKPYDARRLSSLIHSAAQLSRTNRELAAHRPRGGSAS